MFRDIPAFDRTSVHQRLCWYPLQLNIFWCSSCVECLLPSRALLLIKAVVFYRQTESLKHKLITAFVCNKQSI
jgi:hypothetical protein